MLNDDTFGSNPTGPAGSGTNPQYGTGVSTAPAKTTTNDAAHTNPLANSPSQGDWNGAGSDKTVSNSGTTNFAPTQADITKDPSKYAGTSFDPNLWITNPNQNTQNSAGAGNLNPSPLNWQNKLGNTNFAGAFSGGNSQYLGMLSPEDRNLVMSVGSDDPRIGQIIQKYGLQWDPGSGRMFKPDDWLATNNPNVQVNKLTGGTYNKPGMGYVDPSSTFGTNKADPNSLYNLPGGQYSADKKTGGLTLAGKMLGGGTDTTSQGAGTGSGTGTGAGTGTGTGASSGAGTGTGGGLGPTEDPQVTALKALLGVNKNLQNNGAGGAAGSILNPFALQMLGLPTDIQQYRDYKGNPTDLNTAQSSYGQQLGSPYQARNDIMAILTGQDPRLMNAQNSTYQQQRGNLPPNVTPL